MPGAACEWNKSGFDGGGSRTMEFDFRDVRTLGSVLALRALRGCRCQDDGHQVPGDPWKGQTFEAGCLIGRLY